LVLGQGRCAAPDTPATQAEACVVFFRHKSDEQLGTDPSCCVVDLWNKSTADKLRD